MNNLTETVDFMKSNDYKERFIAEYWQLKIRYDKLTNFVAKIEIAEIKGETSPKHDCPLSLLRMQKKYMGEYLVTLEARAKIENINLGGIK